MEKNTKKVIFGEFMRGCINLLGIKDPDKAQSLLRGAIEEAAATVGPVIAMGSQGEVYVSDELRSRKISKGWHNGLPPGVTEADASKELNLGGDILPARKFTFREVDPGSLSLSQSMYMVALRPWGNLIENIGQTAIFVRENNFKK